MKTATTTAESAAKSPPPRNPLYELRELGMRYGEKPVLRSVSLELRAGEAVSIIGPNGAGKSTLLNILGGLLPGHEGVCNLNGVDVRKWQRRALARAVGFIPQSLSMEFPFTVQEVVAMGRHPHISGVFESPEDWVAVEDAMHLTDCHAFRDRDFRSLSGGERQRVILASALAQQPCILLLDEPTTWLDLRHQVDIHRVLDNLRREGLLIVMVTHDLNLAAGFADRIVMLHHGELRGDGPPRVMITEQNIREIFDVPAKVRMEDDGRPWVVYGR